MNKFIQLHVLTSYPPSNLNRDDLGRPKTAKMGNADRLRVSSQSLKRAWRTSPVFASALDGHTGTRSKHLGQEVFKQLQSLGVNDKKASKWAEAIAGVFGKNKKDNPLEIEQLAHVSNAEMQAVKSLAETLAKEDREPSKEELALLKLEEMSVDIALFGRMLASSPEFNVEAACQVAHAISVHPVVIEDDFFTAVDDLNVDPSDSGAAHLGEAGFAAGLFYTYICIDAELLLENLGGEENKALCQKALAALTEAVLTIGPKGKQNSFASRAKASYALAEVGEQQPRSLSVAFLQPLTGRDQLRDAIKHLKQHREQQEKIYGAACTSAVEINSVPGEQTATMQEFIATICE